MTLFYCTHPTPLGDLLVATRNGALIAVGLPGQDFDAILARLTSDTGERAHQSRDDLGDVTEQIDGYFAGDLTGFDLDLDLSGSTQFRRRVLDYLASIPYGQTRTYAEVAAGVGSPRAVRAVGSACATNPIPIVVPCHRVLKGDGTLGGYAGGLDMKTFLLGLEK